MDFTKKKKGKKEEKNKPDLLPAPLGIHSQDNTRIKSIFIPRRNTRCLTNPFLQTRKQCGTRTKQKPNAPKGINVFPLTLGR